MPNFIAESIVRESALDEDEEAPESSPISSPQGKAFKNPFAEFQKNKQPNPHAYVDIGSPISDT
jgi:hypothetical protein